MPETTIAPLDKIKPEDLEFIYQNGVKYLESTLKSMEAISNRSLVLLSYLIIVISFTVSHTVSFILKKHCTIFTTINPDILNISIVTAGILLTLYYMRISWNIVLYSKPREAHIAYSLPRNMWGIEINEQGERFIKWIRCTELQNDIMVNREIIKDMSFQFENAIACTFIIPKVYRLICKCKL